MIINFNNAIRITVILTALHSSSIQANDLQKFKSLKKTFTELNLPAVQLGFENQINDQLNNKYNIQEQNKVNQVLLSSENVNTNNLCELIEYEKIKFDLKQHKSRLVLLNQLSKESFQYKGSIYDLSNHKQWYQLLMQGWLGADINPKELKKMGEVEFQIAHKQLTKIKTHSKDKTIPSQQSQAIEKAYSNTEKTVMGQLDKLFPEEWDFKPVKIERSDLGHSFPAPGFYNMESVTFFYNTLEETYNLSQIDWLFIHEAVPGQHYQNKISNKFGVCKQPLNTPSEMAFTEGWAAYTETLGTKLGLYKDPNSHYFALKWQALRAMRVIIDVGIHAQGWTVNQAETYWLQNFPEGKDVMMREIKRIQNWPMQVNTYVYGKYKIEQLKTKLKQQQGEEFNEVEFHKNIVSLSQLPLASLNYYQQFFNK